MNFIVKNFVCTKNFEGWNVTNKNFTVKLKNIFNDKN